MHQTPGYNFTLSSPAKSPLFVYPVETTAHIHTYTHTLHIYTRTHAQGTNETIEDDHKYYSSNYYPAGHPVASSLWMELSNAVGSGVTVDDDENESELSGLHRYYEVCRYCLYMNVNVHACGLHV